MVRDLCSPVDFIQVYCDCTLEICEERDVKGIYKPARNGEISNFTGISSPYEIPETPELVIDTSRMSINQSVDEIILLLKKREIFK